MKKILFLISLIGVLLVSLSFVQKSVADQPETVTFCHAAGQAETTKFVTLTLPYNAVYGQAGHFSEPGTPNAGHENDYEGACEEDNAHFSCVQNACTLVDGIGENTCSNDNDCEEVTPTPTPGEEQHYACVRNACMLVEGEGQSTCEIDADCQETTPTPTPTNTPSNPGGPGDGLGCATHDCSSRPSTGGQVLGASIGPAVLGLSTTSGEQNFALQFIQLFGALTSAGLGLVFFKK